MKNILFDLQLSVLTGYDDGDFFTKKMMRYLETIESNYKLLLKTKIDHINKPDDNIGKFVKDLDRLIDGDERLDLVKCVEIREKWILELSVQTPKQRRIRNERRRT